MAPHAVEQGVLRDERSRGARERAQHGERLGRERYRFPGARQTRIGFVELERGRSAAAATAPVADRTLHALPSPGLLPFRGCHAKSGDPQAFDADQPAGAPICDGSPHRAALHVPDLGGVFRDRAIGGEAPGGCDVQDRFTGPPTAVRVERSESFVRLAVRLQIGEMHVVIAVREQRLADRVEDSRLVAAEVVREHEIERAARFGLVVVVPARAVPAAASRHLVGREPEEENVVFAHLLGHLQGRAVARADGERSVHHELHVAGPARLVAGGGDLLRNVARRDETLGDRNAIVRDENDAQARAGHRIGVHDGRDVVDELDDELGKRVGGRRLAREKEGARRDLEIRLVAQPVVEHHDVQRVEELPLVFMDALDLAVEDRVRIGRDAGRRLEPVDEARLRFALRIAARLVEGAVASEAPQLGEPVKIGDPALADRGGDDARERGVAREQPAPRRDPVGLVVEALRKHLGQVLRDARSQKLRMDRRDAVGAVRAHDRQVGHAHFGLGAVLDDAHACGARAIARETGADRAEEAAVHLADDLGQARQQDLEPLERPLLQRFGKQRMVRVGKRAPGEVPGRVPVEARIVEQDAHELGHRHRGMRIVHLDRDLERKGAPVAVRPAKAPHQIAEGAGDEKVLLHEAQLLAHARRVVGIEHARDGLRGERFGERADKVAAAELLEIERGRASPRPTDAAC